MMRLVVTEYPKSGGNWVVGLLGYALHLPMRDIYDVTSERKAFDLSKHPWYGGTSTPDLPETCVIKSHELPRSPLTAFPARFIHLVRDGRDVVVSKYFYEKEFCVKNGIYERFDVPFDDYVPRVAAEWREYVLVWLETNSILCRYEEFLRDPWGTLREVLMKLGLDVSDAQLRYAVESNTKEKVSSALEKTFKHNTFVRKGISGDWKNYFSDDHVRAFKRAAGNTLLTLGYEKDLDWGGDDEKRR
jgi:hypothetical protein